MSRSAGRQGGLFLPEAQEGLFGGWKGGSVVKRAYSLPEHPSSVLCIHIRQFTTTCNSIQPQGIPVPSSGPEGHCTCVHKPLIQTHIIK